MGTRFVAALVGLCLAFASIAGAPPSTAQAHVRPAMARKHVRPAHSPARSRPPWSHSAYPAAPPWARHAVPCWGRWTRRGFVCARSPLARPHGHRPAALAPALPAVAPVAPPIAPGAVQLPASAATPPASAGTAPLSPAAPAAFPLIDPHNVYSETGAGRLSPAVAGALPRAYVPNVLSNSVDVIDTTTLKVVERFSVGLNPQHIIPSWDLKTLWVASDAERTSKGSVTPIDPKTSVPGRAIAVDDPYNRSFTPDGKSAIIVAEALKRLDFRDPQTMMLQQSLPTPDCAGINHSDVSIDGRYAIYTCEFGGSLAKIDLVGHTVLGYLKLSRGGMPQDIRIAPDGKLFYVADMMSDGVVLIDGDSFTEIGFIPTGVGTHGLYPSRDGKKLYVSNRGSHHVLGARHGEGSISVIDFATRKVEANWPVPGGGSPDMGNVSADGRQLWLSGRFDDVVYVVDTATGAMTTVPVDRQPHGLAIWPQPGRYSLGHTGVMR